jgi:hypothetical protein
MTEPECLVWGEACLWCLDLKMAQGCGGDMGWLGFGCEKQMARWLAYLTKERWCSAEEGVDTSFL